MRILKTFGLIAIFSSAAINLHAAKTTAALQLINDLTSKTSIVATDIQKVIQDITKSKAYQEFIDSQTLFTPAGIQSALQQVNTLIDEVFGSKAANEVLQLLGGSTVAQASGQISDDVSVIQKIMIFIAAASEDITQIETTANTINTQVQANNMTAALATFHSQFMPEITSLTNSAIAAIPPNVSQTVDSWRNALVSIDNAAIQFQSGTITATTMATFMTQMIQTLSSLLGLPAYAQTLVISPTPAMPSNDTTTQQLQITAVAVASECVCYTVVDFLRSACCTSSTNQVATNTSSSGNATASTSAATSNSTTISATSATNNTSALPPTLTTLTEEMLALKTFIENIVHTIGTLETQLNSVKNNQAALENFEWRLVVWILEILNEGAVNNDYLQIYNTIKSNSRNISGLLLNTIENTDLSNVAQQITTALNTLSTQLLASVTSV